jgi:hypothetical protein
VLFAAKGLGSAKVPVPPQVLSKLYWSVAIPKMLYGIEATYVSKADLVILEASHRENARLIQDLPDNSPSAAPLATLGWISMGSYIAMRKLMFLFGILSFPSSSIYRKVVTKRTIDIMSDFKGKRLSPLYNLIEMAIQYKLINFVMLCIEDNLCIEYEKWKSIIKKHIFDVDSLKWSLTCVLYNELVFYRRSIKEIEMHSWWSVTRHNPGVMRQVASVMALFNGKPAAWHAAQFLKKKLRSMPRGPG